MSKKAYMIPHCEVVIIETGQQLLAGSPIVNNGSGDDIGSGGGGDGTGGSTPQAPSFDDLGW